MKTRECTAQYLRDAGFRPASEEPTLADIAYYLQEGLYVSPKLERTGCKSFSAPYSESQCGTYGRTLRDVFAEEYLVAQSTHDMVCYRVAVRRVKVNTEIYSAYVGD